MTKRFFQRLKSERGAVSMEYVIIAVLVAAACAVAFIVIGRAIALDSDVMQQAVTGNDTTASKSMTCPVNGYKKQIKTNLEEAEKYNRGFQELGECPTAK